ncbi:MAG: glucan biosynthesis protein G [Nitrospirales bacterium]
MLKMFHALIVMLMMWPMQAAAGFTLDQVVQKAKALAEKPYEAPQPVSKFMREISYEAYQGIRFNPDRSLWKDSQANFQVMFMAPGLYYTHPVTLNVIEAEGPRPLLFKKTDFVFADPEVEKRVPADVGFAGFKLTFPFNKKNEQNQFLVFAGASYFRGVGKDNAFGISGRGIAIDTGLPSGEIFPAFTEFWLVRPSPDAKEMMVYGLLDSPSLTGAYQFTIIPGSTTKLKVRTFLFPRKDIQLLGIAPLTSMFFYGKNTPRPTGEWRREVHDSDGLQIHDGISGEWLWRPLLNPETLEMDFFSTDNVQGFGLLQREGKFSSYEDLAAHYERRPSAWVEPQGDWRQGKVVLVQLPTPDETNDNIVAFWTPKAPVTQGTPLELAYDIGFGKADIPQNPMGTAVNTFIGDGNRIGGGRVPQSYRIIIDFAGGPLSKLPANAPVNGQVTALEEGEILEHFVEYHEQIKGWRLSILAKPAAKKPLHLRAYLNTEATALTETWTYRLPANNRILVKEKE